MGRIAIDITGNKYGRLTVIKKTGRDKKGNALWLCKCSCGELSIVRSQHLRRGETKSCGCLAKGNARRYGESRNRLALIWRAMINRCLSENNPNYKHYGARGIIVCAEWFDFFAFRDWANSNGYSEELTLERKDVNGNYEPANCKWATMKDQENNRTNNRLIFAKGRTMTLQQWSDLTGIPRETIRSRLERGWSAERSLAI